tara:strand:+ start:102 stop:623 length:522 start_codon:yes stop_codon:yes gene_type:complete
MSDIKIEDNLLSLDVLNKIQQNMILNPRFPWYIGKILDDENQLSCSSKYNYQFCHHFVGELPDNPFSEKAPTIELLYPIVKHMRVHAWKRIKGNLNPRTSSIIKHGFHIDYDNKHMKASIFYLNTNDGYTEFEDGTKIESIANRLVTFPANLKHTGTTCTNIPFRVVINFNYF